MAALPAGPKGDLDRFNALLAADPEAARKLIEGLVSAKFVPHAGQRPVMESNARFRTVCAGRRFGKGVNPETLIPTKLGMRRAKTIVEGDLLYSQDGKPTSVTGVFKNDNARMYRMTFSDGAQIEVCEDHLWEVTDKAQRPSRVLDTKTIAGSFLKVRRDGKREHRWKLVRGAPVEYPSANLPMDPYVVGVLLGDGNIKRGTGFSSGDEEIIEAVKAECEKLGGAVRHYAKYDYGATGLTAILRKLGMHGHGYSTKSVPGLYMRASVEQRLALLQGLMDTDGSVIRSPRDGNGCMAEFASGSKTLALQVQELARSLGGWASINERITASGNPGWRVTLKTEMNPFKLSRKASAYNPKRLSTRAITDVREIEPGPMVCFEVDHPSALYYAGREYLLTHNTKIAGAMAHREARKSGKMVWWVAPTYKIVKRGYSEVIRQLPKNVLTKPAPPETSFDAGRSVVLHFKNGSRMEFYSAERPEGMLGEGVDFVVMDEAATMPENVWTQIVRPTLADRQGGSLFISTPRGRNWFYKMFVAGQDNLKDTYASWRFPSMANPYIPAEEWLEMEETLPRAVYEQEILAEFISNAASVFRIPDSGIKPIHRPEGHVTLGIDLAKHNDFSVLCGVRSEDRLPCYHERFNAVSWPEQRRRIRRAIAQLESDGAESVTVMLDSTGVGDVVYDDLSIEGVDAVPIKFTQQWKQQAVMLLAADLERGNAFITNDQMREFESYAYEITDAGRWKFEAASGHDDEVSAALLAHWGVVNEGVPSVSVISTAGVSDRDAVRGDVGVEDEIDEEGFHDLYDDSPTETVLDVPSERELLVRGWW